MASLLTQAVHAGEPQPRIEGSVCIPVFQSANFEFRDEANYSDIKYARLNNTPNHTALHAKLAALEGAESALALSSGMAAISTSLLAFLKAGDHVLAQKTLYGGTHALMHKELPRLGISVDYIDADQPSTWEAKLRPNTKVLYCETISNPLVEVPALDELAKFAKTHRLVSIIDNTFATGVVFRPLQLGFDLSVHSATKYLNGHSDVIAGAVIGSAEKVHQVNHAAIHFGGSLDPHACFLLHRGLKTLPLRMRQHNEGAMAVAKFLSTHPRVANVNYPGLESSKSHARARKYFSGFGGMLSFELKSGDVAQFLKLLKYPLVAASLGGVESLVIQPARSSHAAMGLEERVKAGISDELIRYSVGIEDPEDLIADLNQALSVSK